MTLFVLLSCRVSQITKLKIDSNPFAKGFRDSSRLTDMERYRGFWVLHCLFTFVSAAAANKIRVCVCVVNTEASVFISLSFTIFCPSLHLLFLPFLLSFNISFPVFPSFIFFLSCFSYILYYSFSSFCSLFSFFLVFLVLLSFFLLVFSFSSTLLTLLSFIFFFHFILSYLYCPAFLFYFLSDSSFA